MNKSLNYSFYLLGQDSLAIKCAEILLENDFILLGVISSDNTLKKWALSKKYNFYNNISHFFDVENEHTLNNVDFIFSIQNEFIVPEIFLNLSKKLAINYHNSLLPKYAGVNSTSWAIINNETVHGITWHVMSKEVDAGDILKQKTFNIDKNDTRADLDLKCVASAKEGFKELVKELITQTYKRIPQNILERTYYSYNNKLPNDGFINFEMPAETIARLFRASKFLDIKENNLGVPKFISKNKVFVTTKCQILEEKSDKKLGSIVTVGHNYISVTTKTYDIALYKIKTIDGKEIIINEYFKVYKHKKLENIKLSEEFLSNRNYKNECYWVTKFQSNFNYLYFNKSYIDGTKVKKIATKQINLSEKLIVEIKRKFNKFKVSDLLLTCIFIFLFRLNNYEKFSISLYKNFDSSELDLSHNYVSQFLPFNVNLESSDTLIDALKKIIDEILTTHKNISFSQDIFIRYPQLNEINRISLPVVVLKENTTNLKKISKYPISIIIDDKTNLIEISYNEQYLNDIEISILSKMEFAIENLLKIFLKNGNNILSSIPIINSSEVKKILYKFNRTNNKFSKNATIPDIFSQYVEIFPNKIAIHYLDSTLSYKDLCQKSYKIANALIKSKLMRGSIIAVYTENKLHFIISALGILLAGYAYLPINTKYPLTYVKNLIVDSKTKCVIVDYSIFKDIASELNNQINYIYDIESLLNENDVNDLKFEKNFQINPESSACIMYTSGSTGVPKGVIIQHRSILRLVKNTNYIKIKANYRILHAANIAFDASIFEIWGALLNGATLIAVDDYELLNPAFFQEIIDIQKIDILWLTSSLFDKLSFFVPKAFDKLKYLLIGGDIVNPRSVLNIQNVNTNGPRHILNAYGPTENTTFTTIYAIPKYVSLQKPIPIGKPISNTRVYILDKYLNPMPIGIPGQLYIGGDGLSLGYLNNDELTSSSFVTVIIDSKQFKLYKTGDIAYWQENGNIEYMGRIDNQIKIRGFRVELDAIKKCLLENFPITDTIVTIEQESDGRKNIIAYIVSDIENNIDVGTLKNKLENLLPNFMVPAYIIKVDNIPLNINGKIDKKKLPKPNELALNTVSYVNAYTELQREIQKIWYRLLKISKVGIHDNFFDLGGDSLILAELFLCLRNQFDFVLPLKNFFLKPTICELERLFLSPNSMMDIDYLPSLMQQDMLLDKAIYPRYKITTNEKIIKKVLLTGATGFLGSYLLYQLINEANVEIFCLIRESNIQAAENKIISSFVSYKLNTRNINHRVKFVLGDLGEKNLGLDDNYYNNLISEIDIIYHNGAYVHHLLDYKTLRQVNVLSTIELIKFACSHKKKSIVYISSLSCGSSQGDIDILTETVQLQPLSAQTLSNGYEQTKWVSENLLAQASQRGVDVMIFRPPWIIGSMQTGIMPYQNNHLSLLMKSCIQMGYAPDWNIKINMFPVDILSEMIIKISIKLKNQNLVYNISNPYSPTWREIIKWLNIFGYRIDTIQADKWMEDYFYKADANNAGYKIKTLYMNGSKNKKIANYDPAAVESKNVISAINALNLDFPVIDMKFFFRYVSYLIKLDFLPQPTISKVKFKELT